MEKYDNAIIGYIFECFNIDEETGKIYHKLDRPKEHFKKESCYKRWKSTYAGKEAGSKVFYNKSGEYYIQMYVNGRLYQGHIIAYAMYHNKWPKNVIDHINGDTLDNRKENIRDVSVSLNICNSKMYSNNTSGRVGIWFHNKNKNWVAEGKSNGVKHRLGSYPTKEQAIAARQEWEDVVGCFTERHGKRLDK